ncbi:hypothetical protein R6Q59_032021 [Mikania micrantha]
MSMSSYLEKNPSSCVMTMPTSSITCLFGIKNMVAIKALRGELLTVKLTVVVEDRPRHDGCTCVARGKFGLCIHHSGGKRCQKENCTKSAEGLSGVCISHGGGRRCQFLACSKRAQGSTMLYKEHCREFSEHEHDIIIG